MFEDFREKIRKQVDTYSTVCADTLRRHSPLTFVSHFNSPLFLFCFFDFAEFKSESVIYGEENNN